MSIPDDELECRVGVRNRARERHHCSCAVALD
jgi:hypothetical protein